MYEMQVTEEFVEEMQKLPSKYLVILISQIITMKECERKEEHE